MLIFFFRRPYSHTTICVHDTPQLSLSSTVAVVPTMASRRLTISSLLCDNDPLDSPLAGPSSPHSILPTPDIAPEPYPYGTLPPPPAQHATLRSPRPQLSSPSPSPFTSPPSPHVILFRLHSTQTSALQYHLPYRVGL